MTDEELKAAIRDMKPHVNWLAIITGALGIAGTVWGATQYLGDLPKRPEYKLIADETMRLRIEQTISNGKLERFEQSQQRLEKGIERVELKLEEPRKRR